MKIELKQTTVDNIEAFSKILNRDTNSILEEALEDFFQKANEDFIEKNQNDENAMTNLDFDEFWDGVDI
jgi:hypothetical protein